MTSMFRTVAISGAALTLALTGCGGKETGVEVGKVERRTIISRVSESGVIQPDLEVPVAPDVSGEVTNVYVKEGDYVKRGTLLFVIDPDNFQSAYEQSSASYSGAQADYATARAALQQALTNLQQDSINFARNTKLYKDRAISQADYESFRLAYEVSKANVESARQSANAAFFRGQSSAANVRQARENLSRTSVFASMDGVLTNMDAKVGQRVVGTGQMAGTEVVKLADLTNMEVLVEINENDIVNVHLNDSASIEVDAYPGRKFRGVVSQIAYSANVAASGTQDQITNYPVEVTILRESYANDKDLTRGLPGYQSPFRPGMSASVTIFTRKVENVLAVPLTAVTLPRTPGRGAPGGGQGGFGGPVTPPSGDNVVVFVVKDSGGTAVSMRKVKTGIDDTQFIEIVSGVEDGDQIVTGPYTILTKVLQDGMKIKVQENRRRGPGGKDEKPEGSKPGQGTPASSTSGGEKPKADSTQRRDGAKK